MDYYFLATVLPPLQIGHPPDLTLSQLELLFTDNLTKKDYLQTMVIRRYYDIQNIRAFWLKEKLDILGAYDENELEETLVTRMGLPDYVYDFVDRYEKPEERLAYFSELLHAYFQHEIASSHGFLKKYLEFERECRLILTGLRAKQLGRNLAIELQFEDPDDILVAQMMAQKDAKSYEPPPDYIGIKKIFEENKGNPLDLHKALCEYRFKRVEALYGIESFSINRILAYMVQLIIVERWLELDKKKGFEVVEALMKEAAS